MQTPHARLRQRGYFGLQFALSLPLLVALMALVVDLGHYAQVSSRLQTAADSAAIAAVRDLDGTALGFAPARLSAQNYGARHGANGKPVMLDLNAGNNASGDIVLGHWDVSTRAFTAAGGGMPAYQVNAVAVNAHRRSGSGGAVQPFLAGVLGVGDKDLTAQSIAVGGSPASACGFPVAIASCALLDAKGEFKCPTLLTFAGGSGGALDAGFTLLSPEHPSSSKVRSLIHDALSGNCPDNTAIAGGDIYLQNGNDLPKQSVDEINQAVAASPEGGVWVTVPVVDVPDCTNLLYNQSRPVRGYLQVKLTGATFAGAKKSITATADCAETSDRPGGGNFYGLAASHITLVR
ncbi:MAG: hypothetical protein EXR72_26995 [Myxococcales bacterium]|nr:hypothetical protein [Myxococcales bacterium]